MFAYGRLSTMLLKGLLLMTLLFAAALVRNMPSAKCTASSAASFSWCVLCALTSTRRETDLHLCPVGVSFAGLRITCDGAFALSAIAQ